MKKASLGLGILLLAGMLSGCGNSTPSCDDSTVKELLTQIIKEQISPRFGLDKSDTDKLSFNYSAFMTEKTDDEKKQVACKVQASTQKGSAWVHYTARATEDSYIYVEILDMND